MTGTRPSTLLNWDDPEDWNARLDFDILVINSALPRILALQGLSIKDDHKPSGGDDIG